MKTHKINTENNYIIELGHHTISSLLIEGLLEENDSTEVLKGTGSAEKKLTEITPVCFIVLNADAGETLSDCAG